ncbi:MAG: peroxiredoxin [Elusimicrobia bacterium]|nr:peroxiredoxin [Elusimicrobiota bacterium]
MRDLTTLPPGLPVPADDGACDHLQDMRVPSLRLRTTADRWVDLKEEAGRPTVVFVYPRTGEPAQPAPPDWDLIPGARGCTPQSCGFRDLFDEFRRLGFQVFGASSQTTEYQSEFVVRNHIPFEVLSDAEWAMTAALNLPTFEYRGLRLIKRIALVLDQGRIVKVFYPVFPPNKNAETVLSWIRERRES